MLLFSSGTFTVDGVTVFPDHADPNQFWYLPSPVGLAKQPDSDEPQFLLIMYAPDVASSGVKGVGFLDVTVALRLSDDAHDDIIGQIRTKFPDVGEPRLSPVGFDEGSVQIVALDLQGGGGTSAAPPREGTFEAVEHILGAVSPNLFGNNEALFALTLSEEGATILEQAFEDGMTPIGAIYSLKFTGARPALDVKITADLKRVYDSFSAGLEAKVYWVSAGIDATFEKLKQDGAIKVEVVNLTTDQANADKEQWALNLFKDQIMSQWFQPSLSPTTAAAAAAPKPSLPSTQPSTSGIRSSPASATTTPPGGTRPPSVSGSIQPTSSASSSGSIQPAHTSPSSSGIQPATPAPAAAATPGPRPSPAPSPSASGSASAGSPAPAPSPASGSGSAPATPPASAANPAPSPAPPPAASGNVGAASQALATAAGTAAAASSAASPFGVALQLKFVHQEELKTVSIEYNRMDAVQRVFAPQGYFGLMLDKIDRSKHFLKVDGTDSFFNKFIVTVNPPKDFATIGLLSAHVAIDYGDPANPDQMKHGEFIFGPNNITQQVWPVYEGLIQSTEYRFAVDYKFDPESGWDGERTAYVLPTVTTENREINLDPYDFLGFLQISVGAGKIDSNLVDRIEVALQYTAKSGWQAAKTLVVRPGAPPQFWKLRLADKSDRSYSYSTVCYLKDGSSFTSGPITTSASAILISDPFTSALDLTLQPAFDPTNTKLAIVEVAYHDDADNYDFQTSVEMPGTASTPTRIHIPLMDRTKTQYQYRVTVIGTGNQRSQGNYVTAQDPLVLVADGP